MFNRTSTAVRQTAWTVALAVLIAGCDSNILPPIVPPDTVSVPEQPSITIEGASLGNQVEVVKGRSLTCPSFTVKLKDVPAESLFDTTYVLDDGMTVSCGTVSGVGPQLVTTQAPVLPAAAVLAVGSHTVMVRVTLRSNPNVKGESAPLPFSVVQEPERIVYTAVFSESSMDFFVVDDDGKVDPVRLTTSGGKKYWPALSPDGAKLVYQLQPFQECNLLMESNPDGSGAKALIRGPTAPIYSPDGSMIAFVGGCERSPFDAYVMNADGSNLRRILDRPDILHGKVPIQPYIAWVNNREIVTGYAETLSLDPYLDRKVYVRVDIYTGEGKMVFVDETSQSGNSLRPLVHDVSPDGEWAVLTTPFTTKRIMLLKLDGSGEYRWLTEVQGEYGPKWPLFCARGTLVCYRSGSEENVLRGVGLDGSGDRELMRHSGAWKIETPRRSR